jgi:hypothetical protein
MVVKIYPDGIFALGKTLLGEAFESCKHKKEKMYILINYCSHGFYTIVNKTKRMIMRVHVEQSRDFG